MAIYIECRLTHIIIAWFFPTNHNIYSQWLPTGEAFRISDLARLESETLPKYFRHNRFQSLVRQLNFYNFRKINRERTFWVYYHPLFHRDRPEEMPLLRRRTCPGYDGRKNRPTGGSLSPYDDMMMTTTTTMGEDEEVDGEELQVFHPTMVTPPAAGSSSEVSRSPSPSSFSVMDHHHHHHAPPSGSSRGSVVVRSSLTRESSFKSVVSVEEKGSSDTIVPRVMARRLSSSSTSSFGVLNSPKDIYLANNNCNGNGDDDEPLKFASSYQSPFQVEEYNCDVEQLNQQHVPTTASAMSKKSKKATTTTTEAATFATVSSDNEDDLSTYSSSFTTTTTTRKNSKEKNQERQDHILAVLEVSRDLNDICSDYNATISNRGKPRGRRGGGGRHNICPSSLVFGLDKPHDHYYGAGKCDMFTYDCEDGFVIDEDDRGCTEEEEMMEMMIDGELIVPTAACESSSKTAVARSKEEERLTSVIIPNPPSQCPVVTQSLAQACLEGRLVNGCCASATDRTLASAILWFCLSTHPQDPDLATKISHHLKKRPMLAHEFELYCRAMFPGVNGGGGGVWGGACCSEDLPRGWKVFATNFMKRVVVLTNCEFKLLTKLESEAMVALKCWFQE